MEEKEQYLITIEKKLWSLKEINARFSSSLIFQGILCYHTAQLIFQQEMNSYVLEKNSIPHSMEPLMMEK